MNNSLDMFHIKFWWMPSETSWNFFYFSLAPPPPPHLASLLYGARQNYSFTALKESLPFIQYDELYTLYYYIQYCVKPC